MLELWKGKKVAFLGDSITDPNCYSAHKKYWAFLEDMLGIKALVYGVSGETWLGMRGFLERLHSEHGDDVDAIVFFAGTNDFNQSVPIGQWWETSDEETNNRTVVAKYPKRNFIFGTDTLKGRMNAALCYAKENFPSQQIVLATPVHRGKAFFGNDNVQPEEAFPNLAGLYFDEYVNAIKEAGAVWALPLVDLHSLSGLQPFASSHGDFFCDAGCDLLHPSEAGHYRMALAMACAFNALPPSFKQGLFRTGPKA